VLRNATTIVPLDNLVHGFSGLDEQGRSSPTPRVQRPRDPLRAARCQDRTSYRSSGMETPSTRRFSSFRYSRTHSFRVAPPSRAPLGLTGDYLQGETSDRATCGERPARLGIARSTVESKIRGPRDRQEWLSPPPGAEVTSLPPSGLISKTRSSRLGIRAVVLVLSSHAGGPRGNEFSLTTKSGGRLACVTVTAADDRVLDSCLRWSTRMHLEACRYRAPHLERAHCSTVCCDGSSEAERAAERRLGSGVGRRSGDLCESCNVRSLCADQTACLHLGGERRTSLSGEVLVPPPTDNSDGYFGQLKVGSIAAEAHGFAVARSHSGVGST